MGVRSGQELVAQVTPRRLATPSKSAQFDMLSLKFVYDCKRSTPRQLCFPSAQTVASAPTAAPWQLQPAVVVVMTTCCCCCYCYCSSRINYKLNVAPSRHTQPDKEICISPQEGAGVGAIRGGGGVALELTSQKDELSKGLTAVPCCLSGAAQIPLSEPGPAGAPEL